MSLLPNFTGNDLEHISLNISSFCVLLKASGQGKQKLCFSPYALVEWTLLRSINNSRCQSLYIGAVTVHSKRSLEVIIENS